MKFLILGAGPAGLAFAVALLQKGETSFLVLEKEAVAGGLCRSELVDGSPLDIGGGHFLDVKRPLVNEFLFRFMPKTEWNLFTRDSRIDMGDYVIGHPFEGNIWQMPGEDQVQYLKSIAQAGCNVGKKMPVKFTNWIYWKLGNLIAENYMLPYNRKMFGSDLNSLGTYWLNKLPDVSFEETLRSCIFRKPYGTQPGHAHFYYPKKYGYGELWTRMAETLKEKLLYEKRVMAMDFDSRCVTTADGGRFSADRIIVSIPWNEFKELKGLPEELKKGVRKLRHSSIEISYFGDNLKTPAHWVYYPALDVPYHRILVRSNFLDGAKGYWTETNANRTGLHTGTSASFSYLNEYAYPLNTIEKPKIMDGLLGYARGRNIFALGRWGEHSHYNSDVVVERAISLAEKLA